MRALRVDAGCAARVEPRTEFERSLARLKTGHLEIDRLRAGTTEKVAKRWARPGGALVALLAAQKEGKVRWQGFPSHSVEAGLLLFEAESIPTVMHPVNFVEHHRANFCLRVLEQAKAPGNRMSRDQADFRRTQSARRPRAARLPVSPA